MTNLQYQKAKANLGLSHSGMASALGISLRQSMRYASGENPVAEPVAKLLAILIREAKSLKRRSA